MKRVHNIRDNLTQVINQIEYFNQVPEKCKTLLLTLKTLDLSNTTQQLKDIFLESIQLESLRVGLIMELKQTEVSLKSSVTKYLSPVTEVVNNIILKIFIFIKGTGSSNSFNDKQQTAAGEDTLLPSLDDSQSAPPRDFIDLAIVTPADLVGYLEIIGW